MARGTIIGDGLPIRAGMTAVMATEAARRIVVPKIIRVYAPGDAHVREDVAKVNRRHLLAGLLHYGAPRLIDLREIRPVEIVQVADNSLLGHIARRIVHLEKLNRFFPDEGKLRADATERHLLVHRA